MGLGNKHVGYVGTIIDDITRGCTTWYAASYPGQLSLLSSAGFEVSTSSYPWLCCLARKVTIGLASQWSCIISTCGLSGVRNGLIYALGHPSPVQYLFTKGVQGNTHTQSFNGLFSRTTWVGRYQKDKPFWILLKQDMTGWQWHQLNHMWIICTSLQTDNHASTSSLKFLRAGCPSCRPTNSVKALKV